MADRSSNPLLSDTRPTESSPQVELHPLVLLTISDYITRHTVRRQETPIIGAILGQQDGRTITMEAAFQCKTVLNDAGEMALDDEWFSDRLEQFKAVHQSPPLDLAGWFTLASEPKPFHLPIHERLQSVYNESALLLLFHPASVADQATSAGKLPLTLYETVWEGSLNADKGMDIDGQGKQLRFRELAYTVETGEAEMISVDFVARGGGNATAIDNAKEQEKAAKEEAAKAKGKGKAKEGETNGPTADASILSPEDEELLASLTAKANAVRMLHRRIQLLQAYLTSLPPSYLTDASLQITPAPAASDPAAPPPPNHQILRAVAALLARLPLLLPPDGPAFARESLEEKSDVQLVALLAALSDSLAEAKEAGRRWATVDSWRQSAAQQRGKGGLGVGGGGGMGRLGVLDDGDFEERGSGLKGMMRRR